MVDEWFQRLERAIADDGRSARRLSRDAGLGPNFVQQLLRDKKEPGIGRLIKLLSALGSTSTLYVITGTEFTEEDEELFKVIAALPGTAKPSALRLFRDLQAAEARQGLGASSQD